MVQLAAAAKTGGRGQHRPHRRFDTGQVIHRAMLPHPAETTAGQPREPILSAFPPCTRRYSRAVLAVFGGGAPWAEEAACLGAGNEAFYPERGGPVKEAKAICSGCPVRFPCARHGLAHEQHGIWGGIAGRDRRRIRRVVGLAITPPGEPARRTRVKDTADKAAEAARLQDEGMGATQIAEHLGTTRQAVGHYLQRQAAGGEAAA